MTKRFKHRLSAAYRNNLRIKYGLSVDDYEDMMKDQEYRCAICGTDEFGGKGQRPHVDHDHRTGEVRGLLCLHCNTGLGMFKDSKFLLLKAYSYLGKS